MVKQLIHLHCTVLISRWLVWIGVFLHRLGVHRNFGFSALLQLEQYRKSDVYVFPNEDHAHPEVWGWGLRLNMVGLVCKQTVLNLRELSYDIYRNGNRIIVP